MDPSERNVVWKTHLEPTILVLEGGGTRSQMWLVLGAFISSPMATSQARFLVADLNPLGLEVASRAWSNGEDYTKLRRMCWIPGLENARFGTSNHWMRGRRSWQSRSMWRGHGICRRNWLRSMSRCWRRGTWTGHRICRRNWLSSKGKRLNSKVIGTVMTMINCGLHSSWRGGAMR